MYKDDKRGALCVINTSDNHISLKVTCLGVFGGGHLNERDTGRGIGFPCHIPNDKTLVQMGAKPANNEDGSSLKLAVGTLYSLIKPYERNAAQQGESLTITSFGKILAQGQAGQSHHYTFEFPDDDPRHTDQCDYLPKPKARHKMNRGNFSNGLCSADDWKGACVLMWRIADDPLRHSSSAKKHFVATKEDMSFEKGIPANIL